MFLKLSLFDVHLWCAYFDEIHDPQLLNAYRAILSEEERLRECKFQFPREQRRYLITRTLLRTVLSRYADIKPQEWEFSNNDYGRPQIANSNFEAKDISFNISHTNHLIVLGVTSRLALGIDTENSHARKAPLGIAKRFFAPLEANSLYTLPNAQQQQRFFEYWTLKEAYIKARGMGLAIPLDQFMFDFPADQQIEFTVFPGQEDLSSRWQFMQLWIEPHYLTALCIENPGRQQPKLIIRKSVPLESESALDYKLIRTSG